MNRQPNVILIIDDDMGYGAFSDGAVTTPNLNRLVNEGVTFGYFTQITPK